jgi:hypothetical protein
VKSFDIIVRSPIWITAGFAQEYAGKSGSNFAYSEETKKRFQDDPSFYLAYCKAVESELSTRFRFVVNGSDEAKDARAFSEHEMTGKPAVKPELI